MDRDVDLLVETHKLARDRVKAGKPSWDRKIDIGSILARDAENDSDEHAAAVANEIAKVLREQLPKDMLDAASENFDEDLHEIVDYLEDLTPDTFAHSSDYTVCDALNSRLGELYDWADINRVWLNGTGAAMPTIR